MFNSIKKFFKKRNTINEAFKIEGLEFIKSIEIDEIEKYFRNAIKKVNVEVSLDVQFNEPLNFKTVVYTKYANSLLVYPLSFSASDAYILDMLNEEQHKPYEFPNPIDKYELYDLEESKKYNNLVVLPGSNILKSIVNKNSLINLDKIKNTVVKLHPLTIEKDRKEIQSVFKKSEVIGPKYNLYSLFDSAKTIYTTSASEIVLYAALAGKKIVSIEEQDNSRKFTSNYSFIAKNIFSSENPKEFAEKLINSSISCIFNPNDPMVFKKIDNYVNYIKRKKEFYKGVSI